MALNEPGQVEHMEVKRETHKFEIESQEKSIELQSYAYHELPNTGTVDVLEQLRANISQLEDLHGRLKFMMGEVQGLIKRY